MTKFTRKKQNASRIDSSGLLRQTAEEVDLSRDNRKFRSPSMVIPNGIPTSSGHKKTKVNTRQHKPYAAPASFEQSNAQISGDKELSQVLSPRPKDDDASTRSLPSP